MRRLLIVPLIIVGLVLLSRYMYLLPIHLTTVFMTLFAVIVADLHGVLWVVGKIKLLPKWRMEKLHQLVSLGLLTIITSGILMLWPVRDFLLYETAFQIKAIFVSALIINSALISKHMSIASARAFADLSWSERRPFLIIGLISSLAWVGAFTAAQFLGL